MTTTTKKFHLSAVLAAVTGIGMPGAGSSFKSIIEVFSALMPFKVEYGPSLLVAYDLGVPELKRQFPQIAALGRCTVENWQDWYDRAVATMPAELEVVGPMELTPADESASRSKIFIAMTTDKETSNKIVETLGGRSAE